MNAHVQGTPASLDGLVGTPLPPELTTLVTRLLARRPADRPHDAGEVVATLEAIRGALATSQSPTAPMQTAPSPADVGAPRNSASSEETLGADPLPPPTRRWPAWPVAIALTALAVLWFTLKPAPTTESQAEAEPAASPGVPATPESAAAAGSAPEPAAGPAAEPATSPGVPATPESAVAAASALEPAAGPVAEPAASPGVPATPESAAAAGSALEPVVLVVRSSPPGARVELRGVDVAVSGVTPVEVELPDDAAARLEDGETVLVVAKKSGVGMRSRRIGRGDVRDGRIAVDLELRAPSRTPTPSRTPARALPKLRVPEGGAE
jgi:hypothetical protein